jgi:hypothetical protein
VTYFLEVSLEAGLFYSYYTDTQNYFESELSRDYTLSEWFFGSALRLVPFRFIPIIAPYAGGSAGYTVYYNYIDTETKSNADPIIDDAFYYGPTAGVIWLHEGHFNILTEVRYLKYYNKTEFYSMTPTSLLGVRDERKKNFFDSLEFSIGLSIR